MRSDFDRLLKNGAIQDLKNGGRSNSVRCALLPQRDQFFATIDLSCGVDNVIILAERKNSKMDGNSNTYDEGTFLFHILDQDAVQVATSAPGVASC